YHPKLYMFDGPKSVWAVIGSHNLTVGGTETNFEAGLEVGLDLPADSMRYKQLDDSWSAINESAWTKVLTPQMLEEIAGAGLLLDEKTAHPKSTTLASAAAESVLRKFFPVRGVAPPSPIPARVACVA